MNIMELTERDEKRAEKVWGSIVRLETAKYHVDNHEPSYHILSFGGGRQTVALLLLMKDLLKNNDKAYVIFADTGGEHQETYDYISDYIVPYCNLNNIKFVRVHNKYGKTLYDYCWDKRIVPSIKFRDCTSKFKIAPIRKFIRDELKVTRSRSLK
jgi:3'-phosphoadenosine 5'-phosphosulfate sulfotransferase (PAPS reductase)/FAD synthetase